MKYQSHSIGEIIQACREADLWFRWKWNAADPQYSLRNIELIYDTYLFHDHHYDTVQDVIKSRLKILMRVKQSLCIEPKGGRILVYAPHSNTFDGLAEGETSGLFDVSDCPPWGLWVGCIQDEKGEPYILSWIPDALTEEVNGAMEVIMLNTLSWLSKLESDWSVRLQHAVLKHVGP